MFLMVHTNRTTFLCESLKEEGDKVTLTNALNLPEGQFDTHNLAKKYLKAKLKGQLTPVRISAQNIDSQVDMEELSSVLDMYIAQIPMAKKRAEAKAVLAELNDSFEGLDDNDD